MLFINLFEEEENHFACFLTLVLSSINCFNLSFLLTFLWLILQINMFKLPIYKNIMIV